MSFNAKKYDKLYPDRQREIDFLTKHLQGKTVLDIGGGTGAISEALEIKGFECRSLDPQYEMTKEAVRRGLKVAYTSIEELDTKNKRYDNTIMIFHVFNFLKDPIKAFENIEKVLKGKLIFSYWNYGVRNSGWKFDWKTLRLSRKKWIDDTVEIDFWFPFFHEKHIMKVYPDSYIKELLKNFKILKEYRTKFTTIIVAKI